MDRYLEIPDMKRRVTVKLFGRDFSRVLTAICGLQGTIGYLTTDWIFEIPIRAKADVYSFRMVLFELI